MELNKMESKKKGNKNPVFQQRDKEVKQVFNVNCPTLDAEAELLYQEVYFSLLQRKC